jgi:hypothetical protein
MWFQTTEEENEHLADFCYAEVANALQLHQLLTAPEEFACVIGFEEDRTDFRAYVMRVCVEDDGGNWPEVCMEVRFLEGPEKPRNLQEALNYIEQHGCIGVLMSVLLRTMGLTKAAA